MTEKSGVGDNPKKLGLCSVTLEDYNQLESKFKGKADCSRNQMCVFISTTFVAIITLVFI